MPSRVFISYSRKDEEFVDNLVQALRVAGITIWRDKEDIPNTHISNTKGWDVAVEQALDACSHMIAVLSPDAVESDNARSEWRRFLKSNRPVYPLICRECDMPLMLDGLQRYDFRDQKFGQLISLLNTLPTESKDQQVRVNTVRQSILVRLSPQQLALVSLMFEIDEPEPYIWPIRELREHCDDFYTLDNPGDGYPDDFDDLFEECEKLGLIAITSNSEGEKEVRLTRLGYAAEHINLYLKGDKFVPK
jgi:hypothetical protein